MKRRGGFKLRLLLTILGLVVTIQIATGIVVLDRTRTEGERQAVHSLDTGSRIFQRLLADRERQLASNVSILASDFALRRALATGDRATVESALENHGGRIGAGVSFYVDLEREIQALAPAAVAFEADVESFRDLVGVAEVEGRASGIGFVGTRPHQVVLVPVRTPRIIGWIGMGFPLDVNLANSLRDVTDLQVSFWSHAHEGDALEIASTLSVDDRVQLDRIVSERLGAAESESGAVVTHAGWLSKPLALGRETYGKFGVVLQTSYEEAVAPMAAQLAELTTFFAFALAAALMASLAIASRATRSVSALAKAATAISDGDLAAPIDVADTNDEFGDLADTFRLMQGAVAEREAAAQHESTHDRLTGLPNRYAIEVEVSRRLEAGEEFGLVLFDIVRLKDVNSTLGSAIGDTSLIEFATRLQSSEGVDWVGRLGGDEFVAVLGGVNESEEIDSLATSLIALLEKPQQIHDIQVVLDVVAGTVLAPSDGSDTEVLLRRLEIALGTAKSSSSSIGRFVVGVEEANQRRVGIAIELERALAEGSFELHYQPKVAIESMRAIGAEALIRWTHPEMGRMNPEEFIGIAEQTGFVQKISQWVLEEATAQIAAWSAAGMDLCVSINLSANDTAALDLPERISAALARSGAQAAQLKIEVTESAVMERPEQAAQVLAEVRDLGVGVSVDDFGTGHSSLAQVKTLPVDELKIDQCFVRTLREGTPDEVIVRTTIDLAHSLGLSVVAEGIEDRISFEILAKNGCDVGQGYWLGRPMPASDFGEWFDRFEKDGVDEEEG